MVLPVRVRLPGANSTHLRSSRNGVLCAVAMTEGLDLKGDDARFCIFAKVPWPGLNDPYIAERRRRSQEWYENVTALAVVQGSGRVVRNETDFADTFIFDSSFPMLLSRCPEWWTAALQRYKQPPRAVGIAEKAPLRKSYRRAIGRVHKHGQGPQAGRPAGVYLPSQYARRLPSHRRCNPRRSTGVQCGASVPSGNGGVHSYPRHRFVHRGYRVRLPDAGDASTAKPV